MRDSRSFLELRRLAYKAKRNPSYWAVLHDALLETFPRVYEREIAVAENRAAQRGPYGPQNIWFLPARLTKETRRYGMFHLLFEIHSTDFQPPKGHVTFGREPLFRGAVIVYTTQEGRFGQ